MAEVNRVRVGITVAFFTFINIEVSKSIGFKNIGGYQGDNCRWIQQENYGIDLWPLENYTTGTGFITYANSKVVYFYHPCSDVPLPTVNQSECKDGFSLCFFKPDSASSTKLDVNSVLKSQVPGHFYKLAHAGGAVFQSSGKEMHLVYKTQDTSATINLLCNSSNNAETILTVTYPDGKIDVAKHTLTLDSPYSCFRNFSHEKHHMSGWAVFFVILLTVAAAYFFGGMLVLRHIKGATGTEMIPNYDFWVSLPGKIKNCFMRLIGRGSQGPDSYERI